MSDVSEMKETWLRTDEREDILASLRMVSSSCDAAAFDPSAWKWVVVGTHSTLQGAMALHLAFANDLLVASPESAAAWLDAHENGEPYPETMMDDFLSLYKKLKKHQILGFRFKPNGTQGASVDSIGFGISSYISCRRVGLLSSAACHKSVATA